MEDIFPDVQNTPRVFYSKERDSSLGSNTCSSWLILLSTLFMSSPYAHSLLAEAPWLFVISITLPLFQRLFITFQILKFTLLHLVQFSPLLPQNHPGPHKFFRTTFLSSNLRFAYWDLAVCLQFFTINILNLNTPTSPLAN